VHEPVGQPALLLPFEHAPLIGTDCVHVGAEQMNALRPALHVHDGAGSTHVQSPGFVVHADEPAAHGTTVPLSVYVHVSGPPCEGIEHAPGTTLFVLHGSLGLNGHVPEHAGVQTSDVRPAVHVQDGAGRAQVQFVLTPFVHVDEPDTHAVTTPPERNVHCGESKPGNWKQLPGTTVLLVHARPPLNGHTTPGQGGAGVGDGVGKGVGAGVGTGVGAGVGHGVGSAFEHCDEQHVASSFSATNTVPIEAHAAPH